MKALNLTDAQRRSVSVTYNVNRYEAFLGDMFFSAYPSKSALKADFSRNGIVGAKFDAIAQRKYLAGV